MPITGKLVGAETPNESALSQGQRHPRRDRRLPPLVPPRRLRTHLYLRQEDQSLHDLSRLQRLRREPRALQEVLHVDAASATASTGSISIPTTPTNGKFYTTHMEDPSIEASGIPQNTMFPGLQTAGYDDDRADHDAGAGDASGRADRVDRHESRRTTRSKARRARCFACGSTRAIISLARWCSIRAPRRGDPDWRVLYVDVGDGGSGESRNVEIRPNPQRLDTMVGKIVRIIPDLNEHTNDQHGERERPLSHSERQPVCEDAGRAQGDLGLRPAQSAPARPSRSILRTPRTTVSSPASAA